MKTIQLQQNHHLFSNLITSKEYLRSKNNHSVVVQISRVDEVYTARKDEISVNFIATSVTASAEKLRERAKIFRKKTAALNKQTDEYFKAADQLKNAELVDVDFTFDMTKLRMTYIHESLSIRKEIDTYIIAHEAHLIATTEKLRAEMSELAAYVNRAEKSLREKLRTIIAVNEKILRDIVMYDKFEIKT